MLVNHRAYMLLPLQIPAFWEAIKFACMSADEIKPAHYRAYFNELLHALLSGKAQCFIVLDDNKVLRNIAITRLTQDKISGDKELILQCLYSAEKFEDPDLIKYFQFIVDFAKSESCKVLLFNTRNPRVWQIAKLLKCELKHKTFTYPVGGI